VHSEGERRENKAVKVHGNHATCAWTAIEGMACRVRLRLGRRLRVRVSEAHGRRPRRRSMVVADHVKLAAVRAECLRSRTARRHWRRTGQAVRFPHVQAFAHVVANGENPQIVRAMPRCTNLTMLSQYTHGFKADKLEAQGAVLGKLVSGA